MNWQLSNLLRAIAITIVIWIHASHHWWFAANGIASMERLLNWEVLFNTVVNQVGRFTVPLFVILSGFSLAKSEAGKTFELGNFMQRRLSRIIPPYLFFTGANLVMRSQWQNANWQDKFGQLGTALLDGSGDYHLYFLVIILQCYIAYPLLRLCKFSTLRLWLLLLFTFGIFTLRWSLSLFHWFDGLGNLLPNTNQCLFWLPYFLIGIWLGQGSEWAERIVQRLSSWQWGMVWAIAAILELTEFYLSALQVGSAEVVGHYGRPTVVLLTLTFLLWSMSWQSWQKSQKFFSPSVISTLSSASFTTYLIHTQVLRVLLPLESLGGVFYLIIAAIASWLVGITVWWFAKSIKGINLILGA